MSFNLIEQLPELFDQQQFIEIAESMVEKDGTKSLICGSGKINDSKVYFFYQDGNISKSNVAKMIRLYKLAHKNPAPIIGFYNADGLNIADGLELLNDYSELLELQNRISGESLQVSVIAGDCIGINAIMANSADIVLMSSKGHMYPTAIEQTTDEQVSSANINAIAGSVQSIIEPEKIMEATRKVINMLVNPLSESFEMPEALAEDFDKQASNFEDQSIDTILKGIFDKDSLFTLYELFGVGSQTVLASLNGSTVAVVATNGKHINSNDSVKIARFVQLADSLNIPIITFINSEGLDQTEPNATRDFAKLSYMYANSKTPKFVVCSGKVYGATYLIFAGKGAESDVILAWDKAVITPLSPTTSIAFLKSDIISEDRSRDDLIKDYIENEASAATAAKKGIVDTIIKPSDTRKYLADSLKLIKQGEKKKEHGNIPF